MIQPPVYPHGVGRLPEPCWTIESVTADGLGDELPTCHWDSRDDAKQALPGFAKAQDRPAAALRIVQEGFRCTTLILLCGETYVYQGDEDQSHFADEAHLFSTIPLGEVVPVGPSLYAERGHCDRCTAAIGEHEADTTRQAAVDGQQRLPGLDGEAV